MTFQQQVTALIAALSQSQDELFNKLFSESDVVFWHGEIQCVIDELRLATKGKDSDEEYEVFSAICQAKRTLDEVSAI